MSTYAGAIPVTSVACPPWCKVTQQEHLESLAENEGKCFHWGTEVSGRGWSMRTQGYTFVDGSSADSDEGDGDRLWLHLEAGEGLTLSQAEAFARAILAAVEEARA